MTFSELAVEAAAEKISWLPVSEYRRKEIAAECLTAALAVDGLALVPKEPSDAVLRAGYEAWVDDKYDGSQAPLMCAVWTAMLTAASDGEVKPSDSSGSEG